MLVPDPDGNLIVDFVMSVVSESDFDSVLCTQIQPFPTSFAGSGSPIVNPNSNSDLELTWFSCLESEMEYSQISQGTLSESESAPEENTIRGEELPRGEDPHNLFAINYQWCGSGIGSGWILLISFWFESLCSIYPLLPGRPNSQACSGGIVYSLFYPSCQIFFMELYAGSANSFF